MVGLSGMNGTNGMNGMKRVSEMKRKAGMTLIETIVAFAIIAIIIVAAVAGINTIANVNSKSLEMNKADESMESLIAEGAEFTSSDPVTLTFTAGEGSDAFTIDIPGDILTYEYQESGKTLRVFQPH